MHYKNQKSVFVCQVKTISRPGRCSHDTLRKSTNGKNFGGGFPTGPDKFAMRKENVERRSLVASKTNFSPVESASSRRKVRCPIADGFLEMS